MAEFFDVLTLENKITLIILFICFIILILYFFLRKTPIDIRETALNNAGIKPIEKTYSLEHFKYNSSKFIMDDFENYSKLYFPLLDLDAVNLKLKAMNKMVINDIFKNSENLIEKFDLSSFIEIYSHLIYLNDSNETQNINFDLATIGSITFLNTKDFNSNYYIDYNDNSKYITGLHYKYNSDFKKSGMLNIFMKTEYNQDKNISSNYNLDKFDKHCVIDYKCYVNSNKYIDIVIGDSDRDVRIKEIQDNYNDIKNTVELFFCAFMIYTNDTTDKSLNDCINDVFNNPLFSKYKTTVYNYINAPSTGISETYVIEKILSISNINSKIDKFINVNDTVIIFDSFEKINNNFEKYIKLYMPKIRLNEINDKLQLYGFRKDDSIKTIFSLNNKKAQESVVIIYLLYLLYCDMNNYDRLFTIAFIGYTSLLKLLSPNYNLSYNSSFNKTNKLKLYFDTPQNINTTPNEINIMNPISNDCINDLCYSSPDKFSVDLIESFGSGYYVLMKYKDKMYSLLNYIIIDLAFEIQDRTKPDNFIIDINSIIPGFDIDLLK